MNTINSTIKKLDNEDNKTFMLNMKTVKTQGMTHFSF